MRLRDFKLLHQAQRAILVGTGPSVVEATVQYKPAFGVNDVERTGVGVDYLVMVDPIGRFGDDRRKWIYETKAVRFIGQPYCGPYPVAAVNYRLQQPRHRLGLPAGEGEFVYSNDTPYIAMSLAFWMGISELGLIGIDHTGDHFRIGAKAIEIRYQYERQCKIFKEAGMRVVKLSEQSRLPLPYVPYKEWVT